MWDGVTRRKFPRAEYPCLITVRKSAPPQQAILTHTENISMGGVRVIISDAIEVMTEVNMEIDLKDTMSTIAVKAFVCWVKPTTAGKQKGTRGSLRYNTGIRFVELNDENRRRIQKAVNCLLDK